MKNRLFALLFFVAPLVAIFIAALGAPAVPGPLSGWELLLVAVLPPLLAWGGLATRVAWLDDESRQQRAAHRALVRLLANVARRGGTPTAGDLEKWRTLVLALWKLERAAPSPAEIAAHARNDRAAADWAALWHETEERLFSPRATLPSDWCARATVAVKGFLIARAPAPIPKRRRYWLPAVTAVAITLIGPRLGGADAALTEIVRPSDWTTRANAAASFAQQEKWGFAAAHWTAAYLLEPREQSVASGMRLGLEKLEVADPRLARLVAGSWYDRLAGRISPAEWGRIAIAGAVMAGAWGVVAVGLLYFSPSGQRRRAAVIGAFCAGAVALVAFAVVRRFGPLADPQAAFVALPTELRSIPSDTVAQSPAAALPPGTMVVVDRSFLGWDHVVVRGGLSGWIRTDAVVWLYRARGHAQIRAEYGTTWRP